MYYCTACGRQRTAEQIFCTACGRRHSSPPLVHQMSGSTTPKATAGSPRTQPSFQAAPGAIDTGIRPPTAAGPAEHSGPPQPGRTRRSKAWIYYTVLAGGSLIELCAGHVAGLVGMALFGLYARYLYRGGRIVLWIW
jgi:hypothetical protein